MAGGLYRKMGDGTMAERWSEEAAAVHSTIREGPPHLPERISNFQEFNPEAVFFTLSLFGNQASAVELFFI
jgi:hypothetical protein